MEYNTLYHHGILGQKWGVRRFRNADGTLTAAGKKRARQSRSEDSARVKAIRKKKVSQMSNKELQEANSRLQLERQYRDLTKKKSAGKKAVQAFIATAGTIAAIEGASKTYKRVGEAVLKKIGSSTA